MNADERDGVEAERLVKNLLQAEGWRCLPAKHQRVNTDSAEIIEGEGDALRNPDIFAIGQGEAVFAEVKQFKEPVRTKARSRDEHGVRRAKIDDYESVASNSGIPVWLFIFESNVGELLVSRVSELTRCPPINAERCVDVYGEMVTYFPRSDLKTVNLYDGCIPKEFPFAVEFGIGDGLNEILYGTEASYTTRQFGLDEWGSDKTERRGSSD